MKYSDEIVKEICKYIRAGNSHIDAAGLVDIDESTFYRWREKRASFASALKKAELECKARNIAIIQNAAQTTWQAAAWHLERKYSNEFALKQINELVGKDGQPLQFTFKVDLAGGYIPQLGVINASPGAGHQRSSPLQGVDLAQTGTKNNNSPN